MSLSLQQKNDFRFISEIIAQLNVLENVCLFGIASPLSLGKEKKIHFLIILFDWIAQDKSIVFFYLSICSLRVIGYCNGF